MVKLEENKQEMKKTIIIIIIIKKHGEIGRGRERERRRRNGRTEGGAGEGRGAERKNYLLVEQKFIMHKTTLTAVILY